MPAADRARQDSGSSCALPLPLAVPEAAVRPDRREAAIRAHRGYPGPLPFDI